ncbi:MAG: phospholipase D family protein [Vicinamibacterales bacterium]
MNALDVHSQRSAFSDLVRPPAGYRLEACIGTTYSLEFDAFTGLLLAFVGAEVENPEQNPAAVLTTLAGLRDRLRVYVNAGSLHAPATAHRVFGRYDRILKPVSLAGAAFHPKVWVMKFVPLGRPEQRHEQPVFRLLCASRNATAAANWELGVALEGRLQGKPNAFGSAVAQFCGVVTGGTRTLPDAIAVLLDELPRVRFDGGREGATDLRFEWQWPSRKALQSALPKKASRAILISPFVRGGFLERLCATVDDLVVISTQTELDALPDAAHERLKLASVFIVSGHGDDEVRSMDLHAKLLVWQDGSQRETLIGSANATGSAWGLGSVRNCEAMVALRPGLRVDEVYRAFVSPERHVLHGWIERYSRQPVALSDEEQAERDLEAVCRFLAGCSLAGSFDRKGKLLAIRWASGNPPLSIGPQFTVDVVPLLQQTTGLWQPYAGLPRGLRFPNVALDELSAFVVVRVRHQTFETLERRFCVQVALDLDDQDWEARDDAMNARLLENVDARAVLLNVLMGRSVGTVVSSSAGGGGAASRPLLEHVTIERVLEVCTADPTRVPQVDEVLRACRDVKSLDAFRGFWANFATALAEDDARV